MCKRNKKSCIVCKFVKKLPRQGWDLDESYDWKRIWLEVYMIGAVRAVSDVADCGIKCLLWISVLQGKLLHRSCIYGML